VVLDNILSRHLELPTVFVGGEPALPAPKASPRGGQEIFIYMFIVKILVKDISSQKTFVDMTIKHSFLQLSKFLFHTMGSLIRIEHKSCCTNVKRSSPTSGILIFYSILFSLFSPPPKRHQQSFLNTA
jgi:hypothetical protein